MSMSLNSLTLSNEAKFTVFEKRFLPALLQDTGKFVTAKIDQT